METPSHNDPSILPKTFGLQAVSRRIESCNHGILQHTDGSTAGRPNGQCLPGACSFNFWSTPLNVCISLLAIMLGGGGVAPNTATHSSDTSNKTKQHNPDFRIGTRRQNSKQECHSRCAQQELVCYPLSSLNGA